MKRYELSALAFLLLIACGILTTGCSADLEEGQTVKETFTREMTKTGQKTEALKEAKIVQVGERFYQLQSDGSLALLEAETVERLTGLAGTPSIVIQNHAFADPRTERSSSDISLAIDFENEKTRRQLAEMEVKDLKQEMAALQGQLTQLQKQIGGWQSASAATLGELEKLKKRNQQLQQAIDDWQSAHADNLERLEILKQQNQQLQLELQKAEQSVQTERQAKKNLSDQLSQLRQRQESSDGWRATTDEKVKKNRFFIYPLSPYQTGTICYLEGGFSFNGKFFAYPPELSEGELRYEVPGEGIYRFGVGVC